MRETNNLFELWLSYFNQEVITQQESVPLIFLQLMKLVSSSVNNQTFYKFRVIRRKDKSEFVDDFIFMYYRTDDIGIL